MTLRNFPNLWLPHFPWPIANQHKYDRGHTIILGGAYTSTGATKIAAHCALRVGAGLVSVACHPDTLSFYATAFQAVMTKPIQNRQVFEKLISDARVTSILLGPGAGVTARTKNYVLSALNAKKAIVLDADALTVFAARPAELFHAIQAPCILTPHAGEFERLFGEITDRAENALSAARLSKAIIILKGSETVITAPDGRVVINPPATPFLATAGSGDALAGICTGLLAQGMPAFEAACAAVWLHSTAAEKFGPGLIAEDISALLPPSLAQLYSPKP